LTKKNGVRWQNSLWRVAVDQYEVRLHRFLWRRLSKQDYEDVIQDIYLKLLHVDHSDFIQDPRAYIFRVAKNTVADFWRADKRLRDNICIDTDTMQSVSEHPEDNRSDGVGESVISSQSLESAFNQLSKVQAVALLRHERDGHSYAQIAKELGVSKRAVERYLLKARERLWLALQSDLDGNPEISAGKKETP
jgi:RNA polymerase sigma factor (sigma-70 family)